jgi:hypothetical protein
MIPTLLRHLARETLRVGIGFVPTHTRADTQYIGCKLGGHNPSGVGGVEKLYSHQGPLSRGVCIFSQMGKADTGSPHKPN